MDWHDLAYFVCLVEQQTLTACAEQLGVQHSTVSRRIERLEQALSLTLFDRLGKRYILTQEGAFVFSSGRSAKRDCHLRTHGNRPKRDTRQCHHISTTSVGK